MAYPDPAGYGRSPGAWHDERDHRRDIVDHDYVDKYTLGYDELKARAEQYRQNGWRRSRAFRPTTSASLPASLCNHPAFRDPRRRCPRALSGRRRCCSSRQLPAGASQAPGDTWAAALGMPIWEFPEFPDHSSSAPTGSSQVRASSTSSTWALRSRVSWELDPPLRSVFIHNSNPVSQQQNANKLIKGLKREDLFTVVSEIFITDTAPLCRHYPARHPTGRAVRPGRDPGPST